MLVHSRFLRFLTNPYCVRVVTEYAPETLDFTFFSRKYDVDIVQVKPATFEDQIASLPRECVVLNLIDNVDDDEGVIGGITAIHTYEMNLLPYTGASAKTFSTSKLSIKRAGVNTPKHVLVQNRNFKAVEAQLDELTYPIIVKPETDYGGSTFIRKEMRILNKQALKKRVAAFPCANMLCEEFIEGREYTVVAYERLRQKTTPIVLDPIEILLPPGETFQHEALKWEDFNAIQFGDVPENSQVKGAIQTTVAEAWRILGHDGYFRYDVRVRGGKADGEITPNDVYIVDANPYCSLFCQPDRMDEADEILKRSKITDHLHFTKHLIKLAIQREKKRRRVEARKVSKVVRKTKILTSKTAKLEVAEAIEK
eukprot:PhF_6_TR14243/c0_g1_i2/m.22855/K01921/ddl; D-alanine-D-alanine ligase